MRPKLTTPPQLSNLGTDNTQKTSNILKTNWLLDLKFGARISNQSLECSDKQLSFPPERPLATVQLQKAINYSIASLIRRVNPSTIFKQAKTFTTRYGIEVKVGITFQDGDRFNSCQVIYSQFGLTIHQHDHQARRRFVQWALNEIAVVPDFQKRILLSDEAHFWLNGYVNKQNCRI
ncbi:hypothetical protein TNCV_1760901 [Trichonephila clavipes]|nr:hypothetical protein TNCV_1760901 [Trichonephila clavipes]